MSVKLQQKRRASSRGRPRSYGFAFGIGLSSANENLTEVLEGSHLRVLTLSPS